MKLIFNKGDIVRAKRGLLLRPLNFLITRSQILTVVDMGETTYVGENHTSIAVTVKDIDGNIKVYSQNHLEKI